MDVSVEILDQEVINEISRVPLDEQRSFLTRALQIGVLALRTARGEIDSRVIKAQLDEALGKLQGLLTTHANGVSFELRQIVTDYISNKMPKNLEKSQHDLDLLLLNFRQNHSKDIDQVMRGFLAPTSPIFKALSASDTEGFLFQMKTSFTQTLDAMVNAMREQVLNQFTLDNPASALSRVTELVEKSQRSLLSAFDLNDDASALSRLRKESNDRFINLTAQQAAFEQEVRAVLEKLDARKEERAATTAHGVIFEDAVGERLGKLVKAWHQLIEPSGNTTGLIRNCKVGDFVITLSSESRAPGARIAVEAKSAGGYTMTKILDESKLARDNRGAQLSIFVIDRQYADPTWHVVDRYGDALIVVWSPDDQSDLPLWAAFATACGAAAKESAAKKGSTFDAAKIERAVLEVQKRVGTLAEITTWAATIKNSAEKIENRVTIASSALQKQVETLLDHVAELKEAA